MTIAETLENMNAQIAEVMALPPSLMQSRPHRTVVEVQAVIDEYWLRVAKRLGVCMDEHGLLREGR